MFCYLAIKEKMPFLLGKFSVTMTFWASPIQKSRCSCAVSGRKDSVPRHFLAWEEYGSHQEAWRSECKACTCFGWTPCYIAEAPCPVPEVVLVHFLADLSRRRPLGALELRLSAARCPIFQVQQSSKQGGSPAQRWLHNDMQAPCLPAQCVARPPQVQGVARQSRKNCTYPPISTENKATSELISIYYPQGKKESYPADATHE